MSEAGPQTLDALQSYEHQGQTLDLDCGGPHVVISILTPFMLRVRLAPEGTLAPRRSWAVAQADEAFPEVPHELEEHEDSVVLRTEALSLHILRTPCRLTFTDPQGRSFCADAEGLGWGPTKWSTTGPRCSKRIEDGEHFYGFGERTGRLDKRSWELTNWTVDPLFDQGPGTDPLYTAIPVFLALRPGLAYGIYFNNTWRSRFDMGRRKPGTWVMEAEHGELDYYVIYGPRPAQVLEGFGKLLGTMPLPPRWTLGFHQSRWSYESGAIIRELAAEFRGRNIPCDAIHFDIDYMRGYRVFTWDPDRFPNPERLIADLRRDGFRSVTIIDPGVKVDPDYWVYQEGLERNYFIRRADGEVFHGYVWPDDSVFSDYTRLEVRQWWGDLQKRLVDIGVSGIWNDMNEPTVFEAPFSQGGGPPLTIDGDAVQGPEEERTVHAEVHNLYGLGMAQASYEGLRRHLGGSRPFVLTRSGFAGVQRWASCWMGDNNSWWEHLEMSLPQLMNMGLSGVPFVGVDIGGFMGNATAELFARWIQIGSLFPFCRAHSASGTELHEPWIFGPRVEEISREYLRLRYRLLPYLYTLFWKASQHGSPVLRPLLYHFPDDPATYQLHDQVMLGPFLLAAPIYHPGREHRVVYLPAGVWYDWWTNERIEGPVHFMVHAPLEKLPLYVRAGAILPGGPDMHYTDEQPLNPLILNLYPGAGSFTLYEDDGWSYDYEQGVFCVTNYTLREEDSKIRLEIGSRVGAYRPAPRRLVLRLYAVGRVAAQGHPGAEYDAQTRCLTLAIDEDNGSQRTLTFRAK